MKRPDDLLRRPAAQSVRLIALGYLDEAIAALERLRDTEDANALHDFRVALRRLRTTLRAYRPLLESVPRRVRRRLREVADATNQSRDAEVALGWLRPLAEELTARQRTGLRWLLERIEDSRAKDLPRALASVRRSFAPVERKLRKALEVYRRTVPVRGAAAEPRFSAVVSTTLQGEAKHLDEMLATIDGPDDEAVHQARIAAKRLRYELEPVAEALAGGADLVRRLRQLQDLLGELHDLVELEDEVRTALEAAAVARAGRQWELTLDDVPQSQALHRAQRRRQNPGLFAVGRRARERRAALFAQLKAGWLGSTDDWAKDVEAATAPLATRIRKTTPRSAKSVGGSRRARRARTT